MVNNMGGLMRAAHASIRARERTYGHRLVRERRAWNGALDRLRGGAQGCEWDPVNCKFMAWSQGHYHIATWIRANS